MSLLVIEKERINIGRRLYIIIFYCFRLRFILFLLHIVCFMLQLTKSLFSTSYRTETNGVRLCK